MRRVQSILGILTALVLSLLLVSAAGAQTPPPSPTADPNREAVPPGGDLTIDGAGFEPGAQGEIQINPIIGSFVVADDGRWSATVTIPAGTASGDHVIVARTATQSAEFTILVDPSVGDDALAATGVEAEGLGALGWFLALGGVGILMLTRTWQLRKVERPL